MSHFGQGWDGYGDPYGAWWDRFSPGETEVLGMKTGTVDQLFKEADKQISDAKKGIPLETYTSFSHPSRWFQAPTNDLGAYLRAAYWLAVGARILAFRGRNTDYQILLKRAEENRSWLGTKAALYFGVSPDASKIQKILKSAQSLLSSFGLNSVAKILGQMQKRTKFAREIRAQRGLEKAVPKVLADTAQLKRTDIGKRPWWLWPVVGGTAAIVLAVVLKPYFVGYREKRGKRARD